jgi:hypothetical protein
MKDFPREWRRFSSKAEKLPWHSPRCDRMATRASAIMSAAVSSFAPERGDRRSQGMVLRSRGATMGRRWGPPAFCNLVLNHDVSIPRRSNALILNN